MILTQETGYDCFEMIHLLRFFWKSIPLPINARTTLLHLVNKYFLLCGFKLNLCDMNGNETNRHARIFWHHKYIYERATGKKGNCIKTVRNFEITMIPLQLSLIPVKRSRIIITKPNKKNDRSFRYFRYTSKVTMG